MMKARVPQEQKQRGAPNGDVFGGRIASVDDECERARCVVDVGGRVENRSQARVIESRGRCSKFTGTMWSPMYQNRSDNESEE
jgi:hypothetical protein